MRIFNETKTKELDESKLNFEAGYFKADTLLIAHHAAVEKQEEVSHYETVAEYPNGGKDVKKVIDTPATEAKEAWDEYEDIQVYIPYTEEEIETNRKNRLRNKRVGLLSAFDKWEKAVLRERETDDAAIMAWYKDLLDLKQSAFDNIPERVQYYI